LFPGTEIAMNGTGNGAKALVAGLSTVLLWWGIPAERAVADPAAVAGTGYTLTDLGDRIVGPPGNRGDTVNDRGERVGEYYTDVDFAWHAFLYSDGTTIRLGLGGTGSFASAINDWGQVIGRSHTPGDLAIHPFLYSGGTITDLSLGGSYGEARAINVLGHVIGESYTSGDLAWHAFLYRDGTITELSLGGSHSEAVAISDRGEVVGRSLTAGDLDNHAFLYKDDRITDLTRLVRDLFLVEDFSVQGIGTGQVVGYGYRGGIRHAYRLTIP